MLAKSRENQAFSHTLSLRELLPSIIQAIQVKLQVYKTSKSKMILQK
jgi:hypothetical protein